MAMCDMDAGFRKAVRLYCDSRFGTLPTTHQLLTLEVIEGLFVCKDAWLKGVMGVAGITPERSAAVSAVHVMVAKCRKGLLSKELKPFEAIDHASGTAELNGLSGTFTACYLAALSSDELTEERAESNGR